MDKMQYGHGKYGQRQPPRTTALEEQDPPTVPPPPRPRDPVAVDLALRVARALRDVRDRKVDAAIKVDGLHLIRRIDVVNGTTYYHLPMRTRDVLAAGDALPWGA